jgi:hypothetical protein
LKEDENDTTVLIRQHILGIILQECGGGAIEAMGSSTSTELVYSLRPPERDGVSGDDVLLAFAATRNDFKLVFDDAVDPGYYYWNNPAQPSAPSERVLQDQVEYNTHYTHSTPY